MEWNQRAGGEAPRGRRWVQRAGEGSGVVVVGPAVVATTGGALVEVAGAELVGLVWAALEEGVEPGVVAVVFPPQAASATTMAEQSQSTGTAPSLFTVSAPVCSALRARR
jgi:hypothetical protein